MHLLETNGVPLLHECSSRGRRDRRGTGGARRSPERRFRYSLRGLADPDVTERASVPRSFRRLNETSRSGTARALALSASMAFLFTEPARAAPDPAGLILSAAEAARQAALRAARWPKLPRQ